MAGILPDRWARSACRILSRGPPRRSRGRSSVPGMSVLDDRDTAAPRTADDVIALCAERDVRFVRLWFTDVLGQLKSFSVGRDELPHAFAGGAGFDGSSITGFNAIEESDMVA